jgi:hypothetical protein
MFDSYQEHVDHEAGARFDDHRERFGDPCPRHGTLRWGGDCPTCWQAEDEAAAAAELASEAALAAMPAEQARERFAWPADDDEIEF